MGARPFPEENGLASLGKRGRSPPRTSSPRRSLRRRRGRAMQGWRPRLMLLRRADVARLARRLPLSERSSDQVQASIRDFDDTRTGMLLGIPRSARCVQRFDDSRKICNSHYLSRFAAFFIDARAKRSVAESCIDFTVFDAGPWGSRPRHEAYIL